MGKAPVRMRALLKSWCFVVTSCRGANAQREWLEVVKSAAARLASPRRNVYNKSATRRRVVARLKNGVTAQMKCGMYAHVR